MLNCDLCRLFYNDFYVSVVKLIYGNEKSPGIVARGLFFFGSDADYCLTAVLENEDSAIPPTKGIDPK